MSLEKMGKNPGWVLADTRNDPSFHMLKNQHYSKGGKIFNINFQLLTSFFFCLILKVIWILEQRFH